MIELDLLSAEDYPLDKSCEKLENLTPLLFAAKYGLSDYIDGRLSLLDDETKKQLLASSNAGGLTPLHFAARYGQIKAIQVLLKHGASPFIASKLGLLPIHSAFNKQNDTQIIKDVFDCLCGYEETLSAVNNNKDAVAHLAARMGLVNVLTHIQSINEVLLNSKNNQSMTPLLVAILSNQIEPTLYLLQASDKDVTDNRGRNALHYAATYGTHEMLQNVIPYFPIDHPSVEQFTPLQLAIRSGEPAKVNLLLQAGSRIDMQSADLEYPIHSSVLSLSLPVLDLILHAGSDINTPNTEGITPLFMLVLKNQHSSSSEFVDMVSYVLEKGADLDVTTPNEGSLRDYLHQIDLPDQLGSRKKSGN